MWFIVVRMSLSKAQLHAQWTADWWTQSNVAAARVWWGFMSRWQACPHFPNAVSWTIDAVALGKPETWNRRNTCINVTTYFFLTSTLSLIHNRWDQVKRRGSFRSSLFCYEIIYSKISINRTVEDERRQRGGHVQPEENDVQSLKTSHLFNIS